MILPIFALLLSHPGQSGFDAQVIKLGADRQEAFKLCASVRGRFGYVYMRSLGNRNGSYAIFPAGRADRIFLDVGETERPRDRRVVAYEIASGRARKLWEVKRATFTIKSGHLSIGSAAAKRAGLAAKADLARKWALVSFSSANMGDQTYVSFSDEAGKTAKSDMGSTAQFMPLKGEHDWLALHGFPKSAEVREPDDQMRKWSSLAESLSTERTRLAEAADRLAGGPAAVYTFPIGRADKVFIVRRVNEKLYDAYAYEQGPKLRWHLLLRETSEYTPPGYLLNYHPGKNAPAAVRADLGRGFASVEYDPEKSVCFVLVRDERGETHLDAGQLPIGSFKTSDGEIYYLRANRPWPKL